MREQSDYRRIGLALSGGGSRAMAFHLGCLRALHDLGILNRVEVLSTVSGGSVIGAAYATWDGSFDAFEARIIEALKRGFFGPALKLAFTTPAGPRMLANAFPYALQQGSSLLSTTFGAARSLTARKDQRDRGRAARARSIRFSGTRTHVLEQVFRDEFFGDRTLEALRELRLELIINATELRTGSAFRFGRSGSGTYRLGTLVEPNVTLARAVTASAAYPLLLPPVDEQWAFDNGTARRPERVILTDGGVYDNLGVEAIRPDRDPKISVNVQPVDTIICCRAGYGPRHDAPAAGFKNRMESVFATATERVERTTMRTMFDYAHNGRLKAFIMPFLGQRDATLPHRPDDLVTAEEVQDYPTNFFAMEPHWIKRLSLRGRQLTHMIVETHAPGLEKQSTT